jgi:hypothetical protein
MVATAAYRLSQAADSGNLSSATYQRLNAFLALFSVGSALPLLQVIDLPGLSGWRLLSWLTGRVQIMMLGHMCL